jgi:SAM-dependent methyltransferase
METHEMKATPVPLDAAKRLAETIGRSDGHRAFVEAILARFPWRAKLPREVLDRDYLRIVDHHLARLLPHVQRFLDPSVRKVLDFGCGSGGSAIALALVYPGVHCCGTDIDGAEIAVARERAELYGVGDRCQFLHVEAGRPLPFPDNSFDYCQCSSVLEYATDEEVRRFCVQEMARLVKPGGLLFVSVPNRLYPFEIHTRKWGWNYFPARLRARIVDSSYWEVRRLARPVVLAPHRTPLSQFFTPWSNFCLKKLPV